MLDTQTGRLWQIIQVTEGGAVQLHPIPYKFGKNMLSLNAPSEEAELIELNKHTETTAQNALDKFDEIDGKKAPDSGNKK